MQKGLSSYFQASERKTDSQASSSFWERVRQRQSPFLLDRGQAEDEEKAGECQDEVSQLPTLTKRVLAPAKPLANGCMAVPAELRSIIGHDYFNVVQTACFSAAYDSDASLLVTAPTGSGKTVVFELALARLFGQGGGGGGRKAVYVAPLRALVQEKQADWSARFAAWNVSCVELTSDTHDNGDDDAESGALRRLLARADLLLTTPEKWDSVTRKWKKHQAFIGQIELVCVDEVHIVDEASRGPTLEAVLTRMKTLQVSAGRVRIVAASATVPNPGDVAEWLGCTLRSFGPEHRPVPLETRVLSYPMPSSGSAFLFERTLRYRLYDVLAEHHEQRPALVFCSTRKSVVDTAEQLVRARAERGRLGVPALDGGQTAALQRGAADIADQALARLVRTAGVGFYHSGLSGRDRAVVSELFLSGALRVICSTSSLAVGINLPAFLVVVMGTEVYRGGGYAQLDELTLTQMIGRAGRPQFDQRGVAVVMTTHEQRARYENLAAGRIRIESRLEGKLAEHLNSEIVLETVQTAAQARTWLSSTYWHVSTLRRDRDPATLADRVADTCRRVIADLADASLVAVDADADADADGNGERLAPRPIGVAMSRLYIAFETARRLVALSSSGSLVELLACVAGAAELADVTLRRDEKAPLNGLNGAVRYPLAGRVLDAGMKIQLLLQAGLDDGGLLETLPYSLGQEAARIFQTAPRVLKFAVEVLQQRQQCAALVNALLLLQSTAARLWYDSPRVVQQLAGIGSTFAASLVERGVTTFAALRSRTPRDVEDAVHRHAPFGSRVFDDLRRKWPAAQLRVAAARQGLGGRALALCINVDINKTLVRHAHSILLVGKTPDPPPSSGGGALLVYRKLAASLELRCDVPLAGRDELVLVLVLNDSFVGMNVGWRIRCAADGQLHSQPLDVVEPIGDQQPVRSVKRTQRKNAVAIEPAATVVKPTTIKPVAIKSTDVKPTIKPVAIKSTDVQPTTIKPVEPDSIKPVAIKSTGVKPTTIKPVAIKSTDVQPTTIKPVEPDSIKPTAIKSTYVKPTSERQPTAKRQRTSVPSPEASVVPSASSEEHDERDATTSFLRQQQQFAGQSRLSLRHSDGGFIADDFFDNLFG